jgi:hypothetical protein
MEAFFFWTEFCTFLSSIESFRYFPPGFDFIQKVCPRLLQRFLNSTLYQMTVYIQLFFQWLLVKLLCFATNIDIFFRFFEFDTSQSSCWKLCSHGLNCKIHRIKRFWLIQRCFTVTTQSVSSSFFTRTHR